MLNCFKCEQEVVFDSDHIGRNGKKIPLDPETHTPHRCPVDLQEKNDHGNESFVTGSTAIYNEAKELQDKMLESKPAKGQSKVKIFYAPGTEILEEQYNNFLKINKDQIKVQGGQFQIRDSGFAIALYYEETK